MTVVVITAGYVERIAPCFLAPTGLVAGVGDRRYRFYDSGDDPVVAEVFVPGELEIKTFASVSEAKRWVQQDADTFLALRAAAVPGRPS